MNSSPSPRLAVVDGGFGNLFSLVQALRRLGEEPVVTAEGDILRRADRVILPGVGAFGDAMVLLRERGLLAPLREFAASGRPFLGICIGMQLLFETSDESPGTPGIGLLPGRVVKLPITPSSPKVPHMGWNQVRWEGAFARESGLPQERYFYFVHSYACQPTEPGITLGSTDYGLTFAAVVWKENLLAAQFHPEKSQHEGAAFLRYFLTRTG